MRNKDEPQPPPIPRRSWIEIDFQKDKVDMMVIHCYLSEQCMRMHHNLKPYHCPVSQELLLPSPPDTMGNLIDWIGNNASAIDASDVDPPFHKYGILQDNEDVAFAFKTGKDSLYFSTKRLFLIDTQGFSGKRKEYMSVPLDMIQVWSVESAGHFDGDIEFEACFKGFWSKEVKQDLRKGKADIVAVQSFIAHSVIGSADGSAALKCAQYMQIFGAMDKFLSSVSDNTYLQDPAALTYLLHTSSALLQANESAETAFKCGQDTFIISTKPVIIIDKKNITGQSVAYKNPLVYNRAFW
eukprot:CCRYP_002347-RA/>CCRYP_002347-RA protein AED:0.70 eAED:0.19 QI:0/0/0/0.33/1/1/3/0/296